MNNETIQKNHANALDTYFGGVGMAITAHGQFVNDLRIKHPVWGMLATPYYMYYSTMIAPFMGLVYRKEYEKYAAAYLRDEKTDVEHAPAASFIRTYDEEDWQKHQRVTPAPKDTVKVGITATIIGGLFLLGTLLAVGNDGE